MEKDEEKKCRRLERRENADRSGQTGLSGVQWLYIATRGIRFGPDRAAVRSELAAHLEDKQADLRRIFPEMSQEEAERRAVASMGDAWQVREQLAKIHKPWLGYLWRASQGMVLLILAVMVVAGLRGDGYWYDGGGSYLWGGSRETVSAPAAVEPASAELGGYTFEIVGAEHVDCPEDGRTPDHIRLTVRVSGLKFWEPFSARNTVDCLTVVTEDGSRFRDGLGEDWDCQVDAFGRRRPFSREFTVRVRTLWESGDWVRLEFAFQKGDVILAVQVTEEVKQS